jgi:hypothetical protein
MRKGWQKISFRAKKNNRWNLLVNVIKGLLRWANWTKALLLPEYLPLYDNRQSRHEVKPGNTGWAQVNGRNATIETEIWIWFGMDHLSFWLDLKYFSNVKEKVIIQEGIKHWKF